LVGRGIGVGSGREEGIKGGRWRLRRKIMLSLIFVFWGEEAEKVVRKKSSNKISLEKKRRGRSRNKEKP